MDSQIKKVDASSPLKKAGYMLENGLPFLFVILGIGSILIYLALAIAILSIPAVYFGWMFYKKRKSEVKKESTAAKAASAFGAASIESTASDASSIADLEESDAKKE